MYFANKLVLFPLSAVWVGLRSFWLCSGLFGATRTFPSGNAVYSDLVWIFFHLLTIMPIFWEVEPLALYYHEGCQFCSSLVTFFLLLVMALPSLICSSSSTSLFSLVATNHITLYPVSGLPTLGFYMQQYSINLNMYLFNLGPKCLLVRSFVFSSSFYIYRSFSKAVFSCRWKSWWLLKQSFKAFYM